MERYENDDNNGLWQFGCEHCYSDRLEVSNTDIYPGVGLDNILKFLHVFGLKPKISIRVSIPMFVCRVESTPGKMKSRVTKVVKELKKIWIPFQIVCVVVNKDVNNELESEK